jgi:hypothetical protein
LGSGTDEREEHFERSHGLEGMGLVGGHNQHFAGLQMERVSGKADDGLAFEKVN